ncbi:hypothetical protein M011DRAFT_476486 [Sporormia fimetaria CBS 119925]|uniref:Extracellular membrane protein CFEM domain-containing protein n=1 Tax=Sporormia fimetaria CBS 119925 TaxID=1340428 RepID=A0A6A6VFX7_9PLEO|nr:hypothetical protein M011DRAFT_476486 [Sporormia fimetaria CBS 119925]
MLRFRQLLFATLLVAAAAAQGDNFITMSPSIRSETAYSLLPNCINQCVWDIGGGDTEDIGGDLAAHLSCSRPFVNGCYCRGASAASAYEFLTSCFSYLCTTPAASDIDSGISVYTSYCSKALGVAYTPNATPQPASGGGVSTMETASATGSLGVVASRTGSTAPIQTSPAEDANNSHGDDKVAGLSKAAFIGIVISATCSVLGLAFGVGFKVWKHKKQARLAQEQQPTSHYSQAKA